MRFGLSPQQHLCWRQTSGCVWSNPIQELETSPACALSFSAVHLSVSQQHVLLNRWKQDGMVQSGYVGFHFSQQTL